mmetsp:Transcript_18860/g.40430  ORF Transcript_18860/g.40430 Transcript_18860/m.40430 type:complete len:217 (-) Transcript_18860:141-791(-)
MAGICGCAFVVSTSSLPSSSLPLGTDSSTDEPLLPSITVHFGLVHCAASFFISTASADLTSSGSCSVSSSVSCGTIRGEAGAPPSGGVGGLCAFARSLSKIPGDTDRRLSVPPPLLGPPPSSGALLTVLAPALLMVLPTDRMSGRWVWPGEDLDCAVSRARTLSNRVLDLFFWTGEEDRTFLISSDDSRRAQESSAWPSVARLALAALPAFFESGA